MPYEQTDHGTQHPARTQTFRGPRGQLAGVTHLTLRDQWSAWTRDAHGIYDNEVCDTYAQALDALRRKGAWQGLPAS